MATFTSQKYAIALAESVEQNPGQMETIVKKFLGLLKKHHRLADLGVIIQQLQRYYQNSNKYSLRVDLEYAGDNPAEQLQALFTKINPGKEILMKAKQNSSLVAGARLIVDDKLFDNSVKTKLASFKERAAA